MKTMDVRMSVRLQDILLSEGYTPSQFRYVKTDPSDIIFKQVKTNKLLYIRY